MDSDEEVDIVEEELLIERRRAFEERRNNCYQMIIDTFEKDFPDVYISYDGYASTYEFRSLHLPHSPLLFSIRQARGWTYLMIGEEGNSARVPKRTTNYNMRQAQRFIERAWAFLREYPLTAMHLALSEMKQRYEVPLAAIATNRGLEITPDVMVFKLLEEEFAD